MKRRWPVIASWTLLGATAGAMVLDLAFGRRLDGFIWLLAVAGSFTHLCHRRHTQHALTAAALITLVFTAWMAGSVRWQLPIGPADFSDVLGTRMGELVPWPAPLIGFVLVMNCRGVARFALRRRGGDTGLLALALSAVLVVLTAGLVEHAATHTLGWWQAADRTDNALLLIWLRPILWSALSVIAQIVATPWLVKTIPGTEEDERQPVALWLLLICWLILATGPLK